MSKINFILKIRQNPAWLLALILIAFFLKEVFLADIFPMFTGQDEARHYNSIQYLAYPKFPQEKMSAPTEEQDKDRLETYNFSEEIKNTIIVAGLDANRENAFNKMNFAPDSFNGTNEDEINARLWPSINQVSPPDAVGGSLYHKLASFIEKVFSGNSILVRFYAARLFSIALGTLAVLFFHLTIKNFGFSQKAALAMTALISFQPRFSIYYTSVNYDALLILCFAVFSFAGTLILKNGASWKNFSLLASSAIIAYLDKGTGIVLVAAFVFFSVYLLQKKFTFFKKNKHLSIGLFFLIGIILIIIFDKYLPLGNGKNPMEILSSFWQYLSKSITPGRLALTSRTYWGSLGWTDSNLLNNAINFIWIVEALAGGGLIWFFFSKNPPEFLPQKKYVWFAIFMIVALQLGIRLADWRFFADSGSLELGAPGRYFIPNIALHIILVFIGLGMILKKRNYFEDALALGTILMFSFTAYLIFDVIIFRFYL